MLPAGLGSGMVQGWGRKVVSHQLREYPPRRRRPPVMGYTRCKVVLVRMRYRSPGMSSME